VTGDAEEEDEELFEVVFDRAFEHGTDVVKVKAHHDESTSSPVNSISAILHSCDQKLISIEALTQLRRVLDVDWNVNQVRARRKELNEEVRQRVGLEVGGSHVSLPALLKALMHERSLDPTKPLRIVLRGDGRNPGKKVSSILLSISILNEGGHVIQRTAHLYPLAIIPGTVQCSRILGTFSSFSL
jgi:hypothetical protein